MRKKIDKLRKTIDNIFFFYIRKINMKNRSSLDFLVEALDIMV